MKKRKSASLNIERLGASQLNGTALVALGEVEEHFERPGRRRASDASRRLHGAAPARPARRAAWLGRGGLAPARCRAGCSPIADARGIDARRAEDAVSATRSTLCTFRGAEPQPRRKRCRRVARRARGGYLDPAPAPGHIWTPPTAAARNNPGRGERPVPQQAWPGGRGAGILTPPRLRTTSGPPPPQPPGPPGARREASPKTGEPGGRGAGQALDTAPVPGPSWRLS